MVKYESNTTCYKIASEGSKWGGEHLKMSKIMSNGNLKVNVPY